MEWISIEDKKPEDGQIVWVYLNYDTPRQTDAEFKGGKFFTYSDSEDEYIWWEPKATAWMPLPEPPRE